VGKLFTARGFQQIRTQAKSIKNKKKSVTKLPTNQIVATINFENQPQLSVLNVACNKYNYFSCGNLWIFSYF